MLNLLVLSILSSYACAVDPKAVHVAKGFLKDLRVFKLFYNLHAKLGKHPVQSRSPGLCFTIMSSGLHT